MQLNLGDRVNVLVEGNIVAMSVDPTVPGKVLVTVKTEAGLCFVMPKHIVKAHHTTKEGEQNART